MYFAPPQSMQVYFKLPVAYSFFVVPETSRLIARYRSVAAGSRQKYFIFLDQVARCFNASPACIPHHFNCIHKIQEMGPHPSRVPHAPRTGLSRGGLCGHATESMTGASRSATCFHPAEVITSFDSHDASRRRIHRLSTRIATPPSSS